MRPTIRLALQTPALPALALLALAMLAALPGCATYRAAPLPSPEAILARGVPDVSTPAVTHPRLPPHEIDLDRPLSDLDVARLALLASPDLVALRAQAGVADAQLFAAGLVPDPQLSLAVDRPTSGPDVTTALAAGLAFDLASLFTRHLQVAGQQHATGQVHLDVAWNEWLALNHVRILARRIASLEQQAAIAAQARDAAMALYRLNRDSMRRGDARLDDVSVYQVGFIDAQTRTLELERQALAARHELNAALGVPADSRFALATLPPPRPVLATDVATLANDAAHQRLDVLALQEGYAAAELGLHLQTRRALPLPQLSINRARDTGDVWTTGLGVDFSLPLWNRNRGGISVAGATRTQLADEYVARLLQMRSDLAAQLDDLRQLDAQQHALAAELPTLQQAADVLAQASAKGDVAVTAYETVRSALLDKRLALMALEQARSEGEVALETAAGRLLWDAQ